VISERGAVVITRRRARAPNTPIFSPHTKTTTINNNNQQQQLHTKNTKVATALTVSTKLIGADLVSALLPLVVDRCLGHPKEAVRKKAILALVHFHSLDPEGTGPLAGVDLPRHLRAALCDKDPGVMAASLCLLQALAARDPAPLRPLVPSLTSILKQVCGCWLLLSV
jgi:AP-4 complex subunit epsilon-1